MLPAVDRKFQSGAKSRAFAFSQIVSALTVRFDFSRFTVFIVIKIISEAKLL